MPRLAVLILGVGAGSALGFFLAGMLEGPPAPGRHVAESDRPSGAHAPARETVEAARRALLDPDAGAGAPTAAAVEAAMEIARRVDPNPGGRGDLTISGIVEDDSGRPLSGVVVRATPVSMRLPEDSKSGEDMPPPRTLEEVVREAVERYFESERTSLDAVTDAGGRFVIDGVRDAAYELRAHLAGYDIRPDQTSRVRGGGSLRFTAVPVRRIPFDVRLPDGAPPAKAVVAWASLGRIERSGQDVWRPGDPALALPAEGRVQVTARIRGDLREALGLPQDLESSPVTLSVDDAAGEPIQLVLRGRPRLRGRVRLPHPSVADTCRVYFGRVPEDEVADEVWLRDFGRKALVVGGRYETSVLVPGTYAVATTPHEELPLSPLEFVEIEDRDVIKDFEVEPIPAEGCLVVLARDESGRGVSNLDCSYLWETPGKQHGTGRLPPLKRGDGEFWVVPDERLRDYLEARSDPKTRVTLFFLSRDLAPEKVPLPPGRRRVEVTFRRSARVMIAVAGFDPREHSGRLNASLERRPDDASPDDDEWDWIGEGEILDDGTVELGPVEPGEYRARLWLEIRAQGGRSSQTEAGESVFHVGSADTRVSVALAPLYRLVVRFEEDEIAHGNVSLLGDDDLQLLARIRGNRVVFRDLPAGEYTLESWRMGHQLMTVRVPEQSEVVFRPEALTALKVHIFGDGPLEQMGFRDGDVIVAVGGREFDDADRLQAEMITTEPGPDAVATVIRNGTPTVVAFDPRKITLDNVGGWLEHTSDPRRN